MKERVEINKEDKKLINELTMYICGLFAQKKLKPIHGIRILILTTVKIAFTSAELCGVDPVGMIREIGEMISKAAKDEKEETED